MGKRKTNDEFIKQLNTVHKDIVPLEEYIDANTKILFKCLICNHEWNALPNNILKQKGCPICKINNHRKTHEEFLQEMNEKAPNIMVIGKFVHSDIKVDLKCKICGHIWSALPHSPLRGKGCVICGRNSIGEKLKFSHQEFIQKLGKVNSDVVVLDKYVDTRTKLHICCKLCNHIWEATPAALLQGYGCPECKRIKHIVPENEFIQRVKEKSPNIKILGKYRKASDTISVQCVKCNNIWDTYGDYLLRGNNCRNCYIISKTRTNDEFIDELNKIHNSIIPLEEYTASDVKMKFKCTLCNNEWSAVPSSILNGTGCPSCRISWGENRIKQYLLKNNIYFEIQKSYDDLLGIKNGKLSYDFYLPKYNLLIEFQGKQHEHPVEHFGGEEKFEIQQEHDRRKREYAKQHNINLIEIWYYDIDNIEKILTESIYNLKLESVETVILA